MDKQGTNGLDSPDLGLNPRFQHEKPARGGGVVNGGRREKEESRSNANLPVQLLFFPGEKEEKKRLM